MSVSDANDDAEQSPSNKHRRLPVLSKACETCKEKKTRCDSTRPYCGTCRRLGSDCIYREKGQPGLKPGYGKALEQRMSVLESAVERIERSNRSLHELLVHSNPGLIAASTNNTDINATSSMTWTAPTASADSQTWQQPLQPTALASFPTLNSVPDDNRTSTSASQLAATIPGLPPISALQELVELFFEILHPWIPIFCKQTFVANMYAPERQVLLHAIVTVTSRFWHSHTLTAKQHESYVESSREQVLLRTINACSLVSTQALALLALDTLGDGPGPRTWNTMSMLVAASRHLGLAKSPSPTTPETTSPLVRNEDDDDGAGLSYIAIEERRRLFWIIHSLDRFSSASHGQHAGLDAKSIGLPYPASDEDWGQYTTPEWFQVNAVSQNQPGHIHCHSSLWHHNIDALAMMDRVNELLIKPLDLNVLAHCQEWQSMFRRLDITMSTWFENLPRGVREKPVAFDPMWYMLHATFQLITIRMYTVAAFPSTTSNYLRPSSAARSRCRLAIKAVVTLASFLQPQDLDRLNPMFAFVAWVASRSLIILWTTGYEPSGESVPPDLEPLVRVLQQMATHWPCAQRYTDIIQLILDTKNNPDGPTGIEIFNDTRRTSYGLQSLLGTLVGPKLQDTFLDSFDFFDMTLPDLGDFGTSRQGIGNFGELNDGDWLG